MANAGTPTLFGMLYISERTERHTNLGPDAADPVDVYLRNAVTFLNSARAAGLTGRVLTNNSAFIGRKLAMLGLDHAIADFIEIDFPRHVPTGIPFESAHYKLDVFSHLASSRAPELSCLVDIDCVVLTGFAKAADGLLLYDITPQMLETNGRGYFEHDFALLGTSFDAGTRWYGGEFVYGTRADFAALASAVEVVWPRYLANISRLNYIGDELVTSAAVRLMLADHPSAVAAAASPVCRYWSIETLAKPGSLASAVAHPVLHLPADKEYLASWASRPFDAAEFLRNFSGHVRARRRSRWLRTMAKSLVKRRRHYRPQLGL